MNLIPTQELEDVLRKFILDNGYVSEKPVDFRAAVQKVNNDLYKSFCESRVVFYPC